MNKLIFVIVLLLLCTSVGIIFVEQRDVVSSNIEVVTNSEYWQDVVEEHEDLEDLEWQYPVEEYEVDWMQFAILSGLFAFFLFMLMLRNKRIKFRIKKPDIVINMTRKKSLKRPIVKELKNGKKIKVYR